MNQQPFRLAELEAISCIPSSQEKSWLVGAEDSIEFLKRNAENDEIVIYARAKCVLIHGVLALKSRINEESAAELQNTNIPMMDDSWCIQQAWGGGKGHQIYLEPPLECVSETLSGGEKLVFQRTFVGEMRGRMTYFGGIRARPAQVGYAGFGPAPLGLWK